MIRQPRTRKGVENLQKAVLALDAALSAPVSEPRDLSGIVKDFEIAYELSWKSLKRHLEDQGHEAGTARQVFSRAYQLGVLKDEQVWLEILADRNLTVHIYDENLARAMVERIRTRYARAFGDLLRELQADPG